MWVIENLGTNLSEKFINFKIDEPNPYLSLSLSLSLSLCSDKHVDSLPLLSLFFIGKFSHTPSGILNPGTYPPPFFMLYQFVLNSYPISPSLLNLPSTPFSLIYLACEKMGKKWEKI